MEGTPRLQEITDKPGLEAVRRIADQVWPVTFRDILPPGQIPYLMRMMYAPEVMEREFDAGVHNHILLVDDAPVGYFQWGPYHPEGTAKLHKIYLLPSCQGKGLGSWMIQRGLDLVRAAGYRNAVLNVNKHNTRAIQAYLRNGFRTIEAVRNDIGGGFYMDDFVMGREL